MVKLNSLSMQAASNYNSKVDFKKVKNNSFENILNTTKDANGKKSEKTNQYRESKNTTLNKEKQKKNKGIKSSSGDKVNNDSDKSKSEKNITEKEKLVDKISDVLNIDKEQLNEILESLNLKVDDLLNENNLQTFINVFFQVETPVELLQIPKVKDTIIPLNQVLNQYKDEMSQTLLKNSDMGMKSQTEEGEVSNSDTEGNMNDEGQSNNEQDNVLMNRDDFRIEFRSIDATQKVAKVEAVTTEQIINQIVENIKAEVKEGMSTISMQLNPEHLGKLNLMLTSKEGVLTANFMVENHQVKESIEVNLAQLRQTLEEQGIDVDSIEVSVANNGYFDQKENQSNQEENKGNNKRDPGIENEVGEDDFEDSSNKNELINQNIDYSA